MTDFSQLSRRERQIMEVLFAQEEATVNEIQAELPRPPATTAIRTMLRILEGKNLVTRRKQGRGHVYRAIQPRTLAGSKALKNVLDVFFGSSVENALAAHFADAQPYYEYLASSNAASCLFNVRPWLFISIRHYDKESGESRDRLGRLFKTMESCNLRRAGRYGPI